MLVSYSQQSSSQSYSTVDYLPSNNSFSGDDKNSESLNSGPASSSVNISDRARELSNQPIEQSQEPVLLSGAHNILSFVDQGIASLVAEGGDNEAVLERIEQAKSGFFDGYGEAVDQLSGAGLIDDAVTATIELLYDQVLEGLDALTSRYSSDNTGETSQLITPQEPSVPTITPSRQLSASVEQFSDQRFAFQLTTADGDTVSINAQHSSFSNLSVDGLNTLLNANGESSKYQFSVDGELDDGEIGAINDLLDQVFSLAKDFYDGDVEAAYQAALDIGYDREEISQYALRLTQVDIQTTQVTYQKQPDSSNNLIGTAMESLVDYANMLLEQVKEQSDQQLTLLTSLAEQLDQQKGSSGFSNYLSDLIADS